MANFTAFTSTSVCHKFILSWNTVYNYVQLRVSKRSVLPSSTSDKVSHVLFSGSGRKNMQLLQACSALYMLALYLNMFQAAQ